MDTNDDPKDPPRRRNDPFDELFRGMGLDPTNFERMFEEMQRAIGRMLSESGLEPGKPYMHGFSFKLGPDGKPHVQEFGNRPRRQPGHKAVTMSEEREPPADIIETEAEVAVTVEMPGVEKTDIDLRTTEDRIEISVDTEKRKYHKLVQLPVKVKPKTTRATYKNGVLDLVIEKVTPGGPDQGFKVRVQ